MIVSAACTKAVTTPMKITILRNPEIGNHNVRIDEPVERRSDEHDGCKGKAHPDGCLHPLRNAEKNAETKITGKHEIIN
jgi:hypothetical protein